MKKRIETYTAAALALLSGCGGAGGKPVAAADRIKDTALANGRAIHKNLINQNVVGVDSDKWQTLVFVPMPKQENNPPRVAAWKIGGNNNTDLVHLGDGYLSSLWEGSHPGKYDFVIVSFNTTSPTQQDVSPNPSAKPEDLIANYIYPNHNPDTTYVGSGVATWKKLGGESKTVTADVRAGAPSYNPGSLGISTEKLPPENFTSATDLTKTYYYVYPRQEQMQAASSAHKAVVDNTLQVKAVEFRVPFTGSVNPSPLGD